MGKILIVSTTYIATGGTELLQQLCYKLNKIGKKAYMLYTQPYEGSNAQNRFGDTYGNPFTYELEDSEANIVIVPESIVDYMYRVHNAKIYLWWLSVDNYYGAFTKKENEIKYVYHRLKHARNEIKFKQIEHLVQSEYARLYLINKVNVDERRINYLSDYLNSSYLRKAVSSLQGERKNRILYNPRKGVEFTQKIKEALPEYEWIALQGFTPDEMVAIMNESKVYIDFGNHPGKDRIPREAAICGCCVNTGKRGAANNEKDIPIECEFKFEDKETNLNLIKTCIKNCMENFDEETIKFQNYRNWILSEEEIFVSDIKKIFC